MSHRRIYELRADVVAHAHHEGEQHVLRLHVPRIAQHALPGQFVHVRVSEERPLRRPISIMRADRDKGTIDLLYKVVGEGTRLLAQRRKGSRLAVLGPIGEPFDLTDTTRRYVLIGGGVGIPPMIFAAEQLAGRAEVVLFAGSEVPFPFALQPAPELLPGIDGNAILTLRALADRGVPCRLASNAGLYGCFAGHVPDLARAYLQALPEDERARVVLLACGPHPMLHAVARLGRAYALPTWLSLEEYMACAVGGCAGCVVRTVERGREYYRRVCVDGPVFPAEILPDFA
ncbi:MAG: dihydroorotate dehydrogenase electron transfer subunit [Zetaproteobacteria bacterium]|nr:MAG: dihydroorotate dehydrogenase electron transfer subunit [Zetaproteobacteria bacterium]